MIWRWDQGRTQYFSIDSIQRIAKVLSRYNGANVSDINSTFRNDLMANTSLPFAPQNYTIKRNYKRVFECSLLATFLNNRLIVSDICLALAKDDPYLNDANGFLHEVATRFRYPFPAFNNYSDVRGVYFPFLAMQKMILARFLAGHPNAPVRLSLDEVGGYLIANSVTGLENLDFYKTLKPKAFSFDAYSSNDQQRQVREMMAFIGQQSWLVYNNSCLILQGIDENDALLLFESLSPFPSAIDVTSASAVDDYVKITRYGGAPQWVVSNEESEEAIANFSFSEGKKVFTQHLKRERNSSVRKMFINAHPDPVCDFCGKNLQHLYPWTNNMLEIHHIWPLSASDSQRQTVLEDLVGVCPSCHRAIHLFYKKYLTLSSRTDFLDKQDAINAYNEARCSMNKDEN